MGRELVTLPLRTRRGFLRSTVSVGAGLTAASFTSIFGLGAFGAIAEASKAPTDDVATILNLATTAEALAVTFYDAVLTTATFHMDESAERSLALVLEAETQHLKTLRSLGGRPLTGRFYLPDGLLTDASVFVHAGLATETVVANAYLAAAHQFALLGQPSLAMTAARLGANEAQHLTLLGHLAGLTLNDVALAPAGFRDVSEAMPSLAPFLHGGSGFVGPVTRPPAP